MTELLKRWHALEPGRCLIGPPTSHLCASVMLGKASFLVPFDPPTPAQAAVLLAAVIEAIEARGWRFVLVHSPWRTHRLAWEAYISRYEEGDLELARRDHDARTPAEAVLSAYLAALEAEAGQ